mmetsp:Transcript_10675/g.10744  ORF Transcript_10675/g.10744 Transcript_10675/m.10744 type:complete len:558 (-) Transcript_10675:272-1945(-)|eukprot:CAMPEP_0182419862 /NCGR_PEP_ID=MMETSP1167-20130531/4214_1 /TAXON_ID=2988 /ORGANISM="Mallomonas Sp, Strain CCMP3275" /LENGTH=557 /DNA_ID=CAMNT_0024595001 /DNA_START=228 /DNA_END=1901 /DNA_ORIENTATION=+
MSDDKDKGKKSKSIVFNGTKKETHHMSSGFKKLARRLKSNYKISANKDEISQDRLGDVDILVFGGPREPFTSVEFAELKKWLNNGGRAMIMLGDGGERLAESNMNYLLEEYGMTVNADSVIRSVFYKYLHPKEVFICDGVLVPDLAKKKNSVASAGSRKTNKPAGNSSKGEKGTVQEKLNFVYPYGASLNVMRPARPLLSSGPISYPMNRPIAAVWESDLQSQSGSNRGRMVVLGSVEIFGDDWLDKEENAKLCDVLFAWLLNETDIDMATDRHDADLWDYMRVPNTEALSQSLKPCLQGLEELPRDFTKLFDSTMFRFDTDVIPEAVRMYGLLGVPHEPLTLIPPQFECPQPKLLPAVWPPALREPSAPALDLFDLDEHFAKENLRLAQLTNKCTGGEEDLEYFISESAEILGVVQELAFGERSAKHILFHIFCQIVDYKRQDGGKSLTHNSNDANNAMMFESSEDFSPTGGRGGGSGSAQEKTRSNVGHVGLAPMKESARAHLSALEPSYVLKSLGDDDEMKIGESKSNRLRSIDSDAKGSKSYKMDADGDGYKL